MTLLLPAQDASPADWLVGSLTTFARSVTSLVPAGFDAYVRIFHPAYVDGRPVRWSQIAEENGRVAHAGMQLGALLGHVRFEDSGPSELFDPPPAEGYLDAELIPALAAVLARRTGTADRCWFAVWDGFAALLERIRAAPTFTLPNRRYHLLAGPIAAAGERVFDLHTWHQTPNLWWPDDRAWCVATEIDLKSTYVGCSRACAADLLAEDALEAFEIEPATGISWAGDTVNPRPEGLI